MDERIWGGGYLLTYQATEERVYQIDFGMQAPLAAEPGLFKLADSGTNSSDAFNWPAVQGDQNIHGPLAIAVPCYFKGIELAHRQFATMGLGELARQATEQANKGLPIDWYSTQRLIRPPGDYGSIRRRQRFTLMTDCLPPPIWMAPLNITLYPACTTRLKRLRKKAQSPYFSETKPAY